MIRKVDKWNSSVRPTLKRTFCPNPNVWREIAGCTTVAQLLSNRGALLNNEAPHPTVTY
jgi:hypothetical protein